MSTRTRSVWVVMANDFPDSVFDTEQGADRYCMEANASDIARIRDPNIMTRTRIYYRWYKLELKRLR